MPRPISVLQNFVLVMMTAGAALHADSAATYYADEPECKVKAVRQADTTYENAVKSPVSSAIAVTKQDSSGIYQVYIASQRGSPLKCISCQNAPGFPRVDRNKPMISWHPSGKWLVVGVEETRHDLMFLPKDAQRGLLQSGIWLNMWITTPAGDRWYQVTDFKKSNGPSDGFVGTPFTPDGKRAVWAEIVNGNVLVNHFGIWKLYIADFAVNSNGVPSFMNKRDITPAGARWVEPGTFAPDGTHILLSSDIGMKDAQGQDQFVLDTSNGDIRNLTNSPDVWDEHGVFSPDGSKISFMSSYPYRADPRSNKVTSLKTEFMLMDSDGSHLQQITHFNAAGYPESQAKRTVAAVAGFTADGSQLFGMVMSNNDKFTKTNWTITFVGPCGKRRGSAGSRSELPTAHH